MSSGDVEPIEEGKSGREEKPIWCDAKTIIQMLILPLLLLLGTQIVTTILPIMYGPTDTSDFNIIVEPPVADLQPTNDTTTSKISVEDLHQWIRPYGHSVHLEAILPADLTASFEKNNLKPPFETEISVWPINRSGREVEMIT
jgi:hypothetical protein